VSVSTYTAHIRQKQSIGLGDLKDAFRKSSFLRQFLQVLGVWIVVECKVGFHRTQLVMLERSAQPLLPTATISVAAVFDAPVCAAVTQHVQVATDNVAEVHVSCHTSDNKVHNRCMGLVLQDIDTNRQMATSGESSI